MDARTTNVEWTPDGSLWLHDAPHFKSYRIDGSRHEIAELAKKFARAAGLQVSDTENKE